MRAAPRAKPVAILAVLLSVAAARAASAAVELARDSQPEVILVRGGAPAATVMLAATATPEEREAARELVHYVERATGARLPMASAGDAVTGARILVGPSAAPVDVRTLLETLEPDAYVLRTIDNDVVLAGQKRQGTQFAVYDFLERHLGIRWLWPGGSGEVVPAKKPRLSLQAESITVKPAIAWRNLGPGGALWGHEDKWQAERRLGVTEEHQEIQRRWEMRNRFGGVRLYGGHSWGLIVPPAKHGADHPEYFALVGGKRDAKAEGFDGKHGRQLCTSNPEVVRIVADYASRFFSEHPDYDGFSIFPNDGRGFCECDACRRLDSGETEMQAADPETGKQRVLPVITDRLITFANAVAGRVARTHPDKLLIMAAYSQYKQPPRNVRPHANVLIQCTFHTMHHWDATTARAEYRLLRQWSGAAARLAIYEYYIRGAFPDLPHLAPELIGKNVRWLHETGYRYYQTQHGNGYAINGFNYYLLGRLLWNPSLRWEDVLKDYTEKGFGNAAEPVRRYLERLAGQWQGTGGLLQLNTANLASYRQVAAAYPPAFRAAGRDDLAEAARLAEGESRARVEFLQRGLRYVELTLQAIERSLPLLELNWQLGPRRFVTPPDPNWSDFDRALAVWEERDRYIESLKNDFVLAYLWVRYNETNRAFVPLARMRRAAASR